MIKRKLTYISLLLIIIFIFFKYYKYAPYKIELLGFYDKIGAHRINSEARLNSAIKYFDIIELDLVFNAEENYLDVNHPPANSIRLSFQKYVLALPQGKQPVLWLDFKNLNIENASRILNKLQNILRESKYPKNKILIESSYPEALSFFNESGFKTSYYLPYGLSKMNLPDLEKNITLINKKILKQPYLSISSDIQDYEILKKEFPLRSKYYWAMGKAYGRHPFLAQQSLRDSTVQILLVSHITRTGNR